MTGWLRPLGAVLVATLLVSALPDCSCFAEAGATQDASGHDCCTPEAGLRAAMLGCCAHGAQPADGTATPVVAQAVAAPTPLTAVLPATGVARGVLRSPSTARQTQPSATPPVLRI